LTSVQSPAPVAPPSSTTGAHAALGARSGTEGRRLKLPDRERLSLACIAGPDAGKIFEILKPRTVIGRANADIVLSDGECSRQHAAIEVSDDLAMLIDLASTNGTYVGERRVKEYELENRSEFDVGASTLMFIRSRRD
jgi:pSer/pThr/pTyr-binding forkhead associated (FHA) protein